MKTSYKLAVAVVLAAALELPAFGMEALLCAAFSVLLFAAFALKLGEHGIRPLKSAITRLKALPPLSAALFALLSFAAIVYGSVKGNSPRSLPGGLSPYVVKSKAHETARSLPIGFTEGELAAGFVLQMIESGGSFSFDPPSGAVIYGKWIQRGAYEDVFAITNLPSQAWYFPFGTSTVERLDVWASGYANAHLKGSSSGIEGDGILAPFKDSLSIAPWFNWTDSNTPSRVWHVATEDGRLVVAWQNALAFRDIERPVSVRLELDLSGDFTYRYAFSLDALSGAVSMPYIGAANSGGEEDVQNNCAGIAAVDFIEAAASNVVSLVWKRLESEDAINPDRDGDGLSTADEIFLYRTEHAFFDSDGDGLGDGLEITLGTDPHSRDSDGDGLCDGSDPTPLQAGTFSDLDGDGLDDSYETHWFGSTEEVSSSSARDATGFAPIFKMLSGANPTNDPTSCTTVVEDSLLSWKLFDGFNVNLPANSSQIVYERTFPIYRSSSWQQFFISSNPGSSGAWSLDGMTLEWEDSLGAQGSAVRSPFGDSLRLQLSSGNPTHLTIRLRASSQSVRVKGPLYLMEYAPDVSLSGGDLMVTLPDGSEATVFTNGVIEALHVGIDRSSRPSRSPLSDEELLMEGVADIETETGGIFRFEGGANGGSIMANSTGIYDMPTLYVAAPALGFAAPRPRPLAAVGAPQRLIVLRPSVWYGEDCHATTVIYDWTSGTHEVEKGYPLDSPCLRRSWRRDSTGRGICDCEPGVSSGLISPPAWISESLTVSNHVATGVVKVGGITVWTGTARHTVSGHDEPLWESIESTSECGECDDSCDDIDFSDLEGASLGSFKFRIPLGAARKGQVAGFVYADLDDIQPITLQTFHSLLRDDAGASDVETAGTRTVSSISGGTRVAMSEISDGVRLSVEDILGGTNHVWEISNTAVTGGGIRVRKLDISGAALEDSTFTLDDGTWSRTDALAGLVETLQREDHLDEGGVERETRSVFDGSGMTLSETVKEYRLIGNLANAVLRETRSVENSGLGEIVSTATYWCDEANPRRHGRLKLMTDDRTGWQYHDWNSFGDEILRVETLEASSVPATMPSLAGDFLTNLEDVELAEATVFGYEPYPGDGCEVEDSSKPRTVTRYVICNSEAKMVARSWHRYTRGTCMGFATIKKETWRACRADASIDDPLNAYSYEELFDKNGVGTPISLRGRTVESLDEDGYLESHTFTVTAGSVTDESRRSFNSVQMPTCEVTELDPTTALVLRHATCMEQDDAPVEEECRTYDSRGRVLAVSYLDGTCETNVYSGDMLVFRRDMFGRTTARRGGTGGDVFHYADEDLWLSALSTNGFRITHHFLDGLGRETNSFVCVGMSPGDGASTEVPFGGWESSTSTSYPQGGSAFSVFTDERGLVTESRSSAHGGVSEEETIEGVGVGSTARVRTLISRYANGRTVERKEWGGMWREKIRETSYDNLGRKVVSEITCASGFDPVTNSVTVCDFLGRAVEETKGACTVSNCYFGAGSRLSSVERHYGDGTVKSELPLYDMVGQSVGRLADGIANMRMEAYENISNDWWLVTRETRSAGGMTNLVSEMRERKTGFAPQMRSETLAYSPNGGWVTSVETETVQGAIERVVSPDCMADQTEILVCGLPVSVTSQGISKTFEYDALGRETGVFLERVGLTPARLEMKSYSPAGDLVYLRSYTNENMWASTGFTYDSKGRLVSSVDALGQTRIMQYDANGMRTLLWGAEKPERRSYDSMGRLSSVSTTRNGIAWDTTVFEHDPITGLETVRRYSDGSSMTTVYSPQLQPIAVTYPSSNVVELAYGEDGRLSEISADAVSMASFGYDALGAISTASNSLAAISFENTPEALATNETIVAAGRTDSISRAWDRCGRLVSREICGYGPEVIQYRDDGLVSSVSNEVFHVMYSYSGDGYDTGRTLTLSNGVSFTETKTRGGDFKRNLVLSVEHGVLGGSTATIPYEYDALGRVASRGDVQFGRDARGQITSEGEGAQVAQYLYDYAGNRNTAVPAGGGADDTVVYSANSLNQYTDIGGEIVSYGADGALESFGEMELSYDAEGRLSEVATNGATALSISYDPLGRIARCEYFDRTHTFVHDGKLLVLERIDRLEGATDEIRYFWGKDVSGSLDGAAGIGGLVCVIANGEAFVPEFDAQGNVVNYRDSSGSVAAHFSYDAFGNVLLEEGTQADMFRFRFSTRYHEPLSGLYLYMYRAYSPVIGRFISRDPLGENGGANLYAFCGNNPVDVYDALGLYEWPIHFHRPNERVAWKFLAQFFWSYGLKLSAILLDHSLNDHPSSPMRFGSLSYAARLVQLSPEYGQWFYTEMKKISANGDCGSEEYKPAGDITFARHGYSGPACDLNIALHKVSMHIKHSACIGPKGKLKFLTLDIKVKDKYDFDYHTLERARLNDENMLIMIGNNLAYFSQLTGAIVPYDVIIEFNAYNIFDRSRR